MRPGRPAFLGVFMWIGLSVGSCASGPPISRDYDRNFVHTCRSMRGMPEQRLSGRYVCRYRDPATGAPAYCVRFGFRGGEQNGVTYTELACLEWAYSPSAPRGGMGVLT